MRELLRGLRVPLTITVVISTGVNLLMLVSPVFMMLVFDRVLISGHFETLYGLTALALVALLVLGALDALRQQVLARAGDWLDRASEDILIDNSLARGIPVQQALQHVEAVKRFFCAQGVFSLLDAPWLFVFAAVLWWMHPWLGMAAVGGALVLLAIAVVTELVSRRPLTQAAQHQSETQAILASALRNADVVRSMGMAERLKARWRQISHARHDHQRRAAERSAFLSGAAKAVRMIVQVAVMALGAMLVLQGDLTPGAMIASSILLGRCLAPVEQAIGAWKSFVMARDGWARLSDLRTTAPGVEPMDLPDPTGAVEVAALSYQPNPERAPILNEISLALTPSRVLALVGPSGSGKTTLCRLLVGTLAPTIGEVRLDQRAITGWNQAALGRHIGYLPQGVELLPGTLKDNIQRFGADDAEGVVQAARRAGVDDLIRNLKDGYDTVFDPTGLPIMSAGQLQRVGLARALYGDPRLVVLDEPNANLDVEGERALSAAIRGAAEGGAAVVVVTHRPALLKSADRIAVLSGGRLMTEGPREEVLRPKPVPAGRSAPDPDGLAMTNPEAAGL